MKKFLPIILVLAMVIALWPTPVLADTAITAVFSSFNGTSITAFQLNGEAALNVNRLRLTPASGGVFGTAWWKNKVTLVDNRSFSAYFTFEISNSGGGGADGIVFAIQTQSSGAGTAGGGIGYEGITPSVGIEFDTWNNGAPTDPNANHIGVNTNGSVTSLQTADVTSIGTLDAGGVFHAWLDYNGPSDALEVRLSANSTRPASATLSRTIDLESIVGADVFVGFTAATGGAWSQHEIVSFYFNNDFIAGGITPTTETYTSAPTTVTLTAAPTSIQANGSATSTISATAKNVSGSPLSGQTIQFTTNLGTVSPTSAVTNSSGIATTYLSGTNLGTATVRGTAQGGAYGETNVSLTSILVGVTVYPPNKLALLAPWLVLAVVLVLAVGGSLFALRRRRSHWA